jgi:thymidylate kinase
MYICLEGIKGAGKTSVYNAIKKQLEERGISFSTICPTKPITGFDIRELLNSKFEFLRNSIFWSKWIYSHRSNYSAIKALKENKSLIIGDRSKLTSYVVRKMQGKTWQEAIKIINKTEKYIPLPDLVIFFNIEPELAFERIKLRKNKFGIKRDETLEALRLSSHLYNELIKSKFSPELTKIKWLFVNGYPDANHLADYLVKIILNQNGSSNEYNFIKAS